MSKENYSFIRPYSFNDWEGLAFADAAYNGGMGGVNSERRACKISPTCDPSKWFGNVENFCLKSKAALYGKRSACDINRHHVTDVLVTRSPKYAPLFEKREVIVVEKPIEVPQPLPVVEETIKWEQTAVKKPESPWQRILLLLQSLRK